MLTPSRFPLAAFWTSPIISGLRAHATTTENFTIRKVYPFEISLVIIELYTEICRPFLLAVLSLKFVWKAVRPGRIVKESRTLL